MLLEKRVFPLYLMVAPSPYVLANANWMLGELASCLPEVRESLHISMDHCCEGPLTNLLIFQELCENVYTALLKALVAPNAGTTSWWPVRASAAAALASLLRVGKVHMVGNIFLLTSNCRKVVILFSYIFYILSCRL